MITFARHPATSIPSRLPRLDGEALVPGSRGYDAARSVWNAMVDRRPALIIRCASVSDVVTAVRAARDDGVEIAVRCGGHNVAGLAVPDGGVMIDLAPLSRVTVDPVTRRARVQGGALLGEVDRATQPFGLATTAGNVSHTGVGGLTLGGGMGWLARRHGLACDNVKSFTVVTADGDLVRASAHEHPDLFWALRGGGGNFGVVVEFEFRLHPVGTRALVADLTFGRDRAADAVMGWRDLARGMPRQATLTATVTGDTVTLGYVWVGEPDAGRALLPRLRAIGTPAHEKVTALEYLTLQTREDSAEGHAYRRYWKGHYLPELSDEAVGALLDRRPSGDTEPTVSLQAYGGAIADVGSGATAFGHRDARFEYVAAARWTDPEQDGARMEAARRTAAAVAPFATGVYVNALSDEGARGVGCAYPTHVHERLTAVKDAYDPDNVFHLNHNIPPTPRRP